MVGWPSAIYNNNKKNKKNKKKAEEAERFSGKEKITSLPPFPTID